MYLETYLYSYSLRLFISGGKTLQYLTDDWLNKFWSIHFKVAITNDMVKKIKPWTIILII